MERSIFQGKLSFAILVWLVVFFSMSAKQATIKTYIETTTQSTSYSFNRLLESVSLQSKIDSVTKQFSDNKPKVIEVPKDDLKCMSENIYYEAGNQSYVGKLAVGQVVLNRAKAPGYPNTVCGVIYEGVNSLKTTVCQFSWLCEDNRKGIDKNSVTWTQSVKAATELLSKKEMIVDITEGATNYHASYVSPSWGKQLHFVTQIDDHIFYRKR
jgi:spore germination cell wall hydrolase CwlJ-like protein